MKSNQSTSFGFLLGNRPDPLQRQLSPQVFVELVIMGEENNRLWNECHQMHPHHAGGWGPKAAVLGLVLVAILGVAGLYHFRTAREQWETSEFKHVSRKLNISESNLSLIVLPGAREYEVSFNRYQCSATIRLDLGNTEFESWRSSAGITRFQEEPMVSVTVPQDGVLTRESWRKVRHSHLPPSRPAMKIGDRMIVSVEIYYSEDKGMGVVSILGR